MGDPRWMTFDGQIFGGQLDRRLLDRKFSMNDLSKDNLMGDSSVDDFRWITLEWRPEYGHVMYQAIRPFGLF